MATTRANSLNPAILAWARKTAGLSIEDTARLMGKRIEQIEAWESGEEFPTYLQLEKLAEKIFNKPVAIFFLPEAPDFPNLSVEYRALPDSEFAKLKPKTLRVMQSAFAKQDSLYEMTGGQNLSELRIWKDIRFSKRASIPKFAMRVRKTLGITFSQQRKWSSSRIAFDAWRELVHKAGVYVFKESIEQTEVSGFCLQDDEFPLIYINNSNRFPRQIFTLAHELSHIIIRTNGVTTRSTTNLSQLIKRKWGEEVLCNRLAAQILVPDQFFLKQLDAIEDDFTATSIEHLASTFSVSRDVILRRGYDSGIIGRTEYRKRAKEYQEEFQRRKYKQGAKGGSYYNTMASYLGQKYLNLGYAALHSGRCTASDLAGHLGIKASNLAAMEMKVKGGSI